MVPPAITCDLEHKAGTPNLLIQARCTARFPILTAAQVSDIILNLQVLYKLNRNSYPNDKIVLDYFDNSCVGKNIILPVTCDIWFKFSIRRNTAGNQSHKSPNKVIFVPIYKINNGLIYDTKICYKEEIIR